MYQGRKWYQNHVRVELTGTEVKRYLNLCKHRGIVVMNLCCQDTGESTEMTGSQKEVKTADFLCGDLLATKDLLRKTKTKIRILKKEGPVYQIRKLLQKGVFLIFIAIALLFFVWLYQSVWTIQIEGNRIIADEQILSVLEKNGLYEGCLKKNVRFFACAEALRDEIEELNWVSISLNGCTIKVSCRENEYLAKEQSKRPDDLVASENGTVISVYVRNGTAKVAPGDVVKKGQVLVTGKVDTTDEWGTGEDEKTCLMYHADADVKLQYQKTIRCQAKYQYLSKERTGKKWVVPFLKINNRKLKMNHLWYEKKENEEQEWEKEISFFRFLGNKIGKKMRISYGLENHFEIIQKNKRYTKQELSQLLEIQVTKKLLKLEEKGVQIIEKNVTIEDNYEGMTFLCELLLQKTEN